MKQLTGIYEITHCDSGRIYVGQSIDIHRRITEHRRGCTGRLANAVVKYGWESFSWRVLEICDKSALNEAEAKWIDFLGCVHPNGFNLTTGGGALSNVCEETREKIRIASAGRKQSSETISRRSASRSANPLGRGYKLSEETIKKREKTKKERGVKPQPWTEERKAEKSAQMTGRKRPLDVCKKQSERMMGKKRSPEVCAAISAGSKGKKLSDNHREKIKEAAKNRGDEWKRKISETKIRKNAERRALELVSAFAAERGVDLGRMAA